jgi:Sulfate permease family
VAAGIIGARILGLQIHGVELVGRIPQGLPSITLPEFSLAQEPWPGALGIALMSFTETIAAGRAFAKSDEPPIRANRELLATGIANAGGAFLGAMPAGGGTTQTAVNPLAGARTQFAELVTAAVSLATILLFAPLLALMPQATLAIEGEKRQRELGVSTWLVGLSPGVLQMVQRSSLGQDLGRERMQFSLELAVAKYVELSAKVAATYNNRKTTTQLCGSPQGQHRSPLPNYAAGNQGSGRCSGWV